MMLDKAGEDYLNTKNIINDLEQKNRKLNEKLNEVIYKKAARYKEKTLQALNRGDSPDR